MGNSSTNKEIAGQKKFFQLKKNTEKTIVFPAGINQVNIRAALSSETDYIRINHGYQIAADDDNSYKFDNSLNSFEILSGAPFTDLSLLSTADITVQLICPRSLS